MPPPIPPQTRQYQVWAAPIAPVVAAAVFLDWFIPFEGPPAYQVEPGLSAAWTQYHTGFLTPSGEIPWFAPLSEPVRTKLSAVRDQPFTTDWKWDAPPAQVTFIPPALSEPVRLEPGLGAAWTQYHSDIIFVPRFDLRYQWLMPLAEPVRSKKAVPWQQPFTTDWRWTGPPPSVASYYAPFSEPVRFKPAPVRQGDYQTDWKPTAAAVSYWWTGLSEPVQLEPGLGAAWTQYHTGFLVPAAETITTNWLNPLSEPVRSKPNIRYREPFTTDWKWDAPTVTTVYNWFSPLSEPVPLEQGLGAAYQQVSSVGASIAFSVNWYQPFGEPVRVKAGLHASRQQWLAFVAPTAVADLRNYWYQPWSEPVRSKKSVPWQQFLTIDWKFTAPAFLSWYQPLSERVRAKSYQPWQPYLAISANYTPFVFADSWWRPFSEPVRSKKAVAWQQPFTTDWQWTVTVRLEWYEWLSEPVHSKKAVAWQQFFATDPTTPSAVTDLQNFWYQPLSEPVRSKKAVPWQQFFTADTAQVTDLRVYWYQPLSEPVRAKANIRWRDPFTVDWKFTPPAPSYGWYQPLSERIRIKRAVAWQQFFSIDWTSPNLKNYWYLPLAEPVRFKKSVPWQQPFTMDWRWTPPTSVLVPGWHRWLAEPVRQKPGLHAARQQFFTMDWKWQAPPILNIDYTLNATETGDSARLFYASMDIVIGAYVTITEEEVGNMAVVTITARSE